MGLARQRVATAGAPQVQLVLDDAATRFQPETIDNKASPLLHPPGRWWDSEGDQTDRLRLAGPQIVTPVGSSGPRRPSSGEYWPVMRTLRGWFAITQKSAIMDDKRHSEEPALNDVARTRPKNRSYHNVHGLLSCRD